MRWSIHTTFGQSLEKGKKRSTELVTFLNRKGRKREEGSGFVHSDFMPRGLLLCLVAFISIIGITHAKALLNQATLWRLNIQLKKPNYDTLNCILNVRFALDRNYEPPSGKVYIENDPLGFANTNERGITGLWTLSEDKNDKKVRFTSQLLLLTYLFTCLGWTVGVGFIRRAKISISIFLDECVA